MTMTEHAYSTDDPAAVAAFKAATDALADCQRRARESTEELGKNNGPLIYRHPLFGLEVVGLAALDPADPPQGWRYLKTREYLVPRRGAAGDAARKWLADHQPPNLRAIMADHGLPRCSKSDPDSMSYRIMAPKVFEYQGTVWALYRGVIDGECSWTPRKLSEFHAAREAAEEAERQAAETAAVSS